MMHKELSVLGVVLSLACAELTGISPGGLIVPGFFMPVSALTGQAGDYICCGAAFGRIRQGNEALAFCLRQTAVCADDCDGVCRGRAAEQGIAA